MKNETTLIVSLALAVAAGCGGKQPCPTTPPRPRAQADAIGVDVDPELARLYGEPPAVGRLPGSPTWSPDGKGVAFLRRSTAGNRKPGGELWLHEVAGQRERPLVADRELDVTAFAWAGAEAIVFSAGGDLHVAALDGKHHALTGTEEAEGDFAVSENGRRAAFVRGHDLFTVEVATGRETRITASGTKERSFGSVTWIYSEEFDTKQGFGLSPDGGRLWFYATDESATSRRPVVENADGAIREQAYPRAGETNPTVRVGVVDLGAADPPPLWLDTGSGPDTYLPQVAWRKDGGLSVTRLDRLQTRVELLACDPVQGACEAIVEERDPRWVNLIGPPVFFGRQGEFLWISEREGFAHIHRFDAAGRLKARLTQGEWAVTRIAAVDEEQGQVYFTGNAAGPLSQGVFRVNLDGKGLRLVCPEDGVHEPTFSPDRQRFLDAHSALGRIPRVDLLRLDGKRTSLEATLAEIDLGSYSAKDVTDDVFEIAGADGTTLLAQLTRPVHMEPDRRYPVVVYVYGGPRVQVVRDHFRTSFQPWRDVMARRGVLVFSVDGRGSGGRGHEFEAGIHRRLGEIELSDQLAAVVWLKARPDVDRGRIGIFGWSYGGTMVLAALLRTEGVFTCGAAVAPVVDWREYDTAYAERYMQRPADNPEGYEHTSLPPLAGKLGVPLLLAHGLADDNVHFANTARMIDALVDAGKLFELSVYPGKDHGIAGPKHRPHLFSVITRFFERNL
ncbi:MAG TPA: DPP IV N-terminal domain-containing protein [Polyangia bacterium]|nr:DPP IV N-terminal domain-containing protein [Polyangia bacterium]